MPPWLFIREFDSILRQSMANLTPEYTIDNNIAIHPTAILEQGVVIKGPAIIGKNCFVAAHAYIRGPVWLGERVKIGPGTEIKQSALFSDSAFAHFNYIGDSIIGSFVNFEAGSIAANHFNERPNKSICVAVHGQRIDTGCEKFGALVGDQCKIGANAVLSPGTILSPHTIVGRLQLIDQEV